MRFERKKLLQNRVTWILSGILLICVSLSVLRFPPVQINDAYLTEENARYQKEFSEERQNFLARLEEKLNAPATNYIRRDLQKSYRMHNKSYTFHPINHIAVSAMLAQTGSKFNQYLYLFFVLAVFCGLFARERETGMDLLLFSSRKGKSALFLQKIGAAALLLVFVTFLVTVVPFLLLWGKSGLSLRTLAEPVQSLKWDFKNSPYSLSIGGYLLVLCLLRWLAGMLSLAVLAICSVFWKRSLSVLLCSAAVCTGMTLLCAVKKPQELARLLYKLGGFGFLYPYEYFRKYDTVNVLGIPCTCLALSVGFTAVLTVWLLVLAYGLYVKPWKERKRKA